MTRADVVVQGGVAGGVIAIIAAILGVFLLGALSRHARTPKSHLFAGMCVGIVLLMTPPGQLIYQFAMAQISRLATVSA